MKPETKKEIIEGGKQQTIEILLWGSLFLVGCFLSLAIFAFMYFGATYEYLLLVLGYVIVGYFIGKIRSQKHNIYILILVAPSVYLSINMMDGALDKRLIFYIFWTAIPFVIYRLCLFGSRISMLLEKQ